MSKKTQDEVGEGRIWIFIAYKNHGYGDIPWYSRLFNDHTELKEFSAKHSELYKAKIKRYHSTYLDLTDTVFLPRYSQMPKKNRLKLAEAMCTHYKELCASAISELKFANMCIEHLVSLLEEIQTTDDSLAGLVAENGTNRHNIDKIIHAKKLFNK